MTNTQQQAYDLFRQGCTLAEISRRLDIPSGTLASWNKRHWSKQAAITLVDGAIEKRLAILVAKTDKTERDYMEIDHLGKLAERSARIKRYEAGEGNQADLNPKLKQRNKTKRKKPIKNAITDEQIAQLKQAFHNGLFGYQRGWLNAKQHRTRAILKSRQIGATWYFAREAFIDALTSGDNQIFLSASKNQAFVFKRYIQQFARQVAETEITGAEVIVLGNGAEIAFLGTNVATAQGYHGHVYMDEFFWIRNFTEYNKVTSGMAMHKKWRKTYFSTPSILNHQAYPFWQGKAFNKGRAETEHIPIDHRHLADGLLCKDGIWRNMVTVEDATAKGCDLFDIEQLRLEYTDEEFRNLLMCEFIDDTLSVFSFAEIQAAMVDPIEAWEGFNPFAPRPFGDVPVRIGYDPSRSDGEHGDKSSAVVYAPPQVEGGKGKAVDKKSWRGMDFDQQVTELDKLCARYNVTRIAIDVTGVGIGVYDILARRYPGKVFKIAYSVESKSRMVLQAKQLFSKRRIEIDAGWRDMASALMTIKQTATTTGKHVSYQSNRTTENGHADLAWALLNALYQDEITAEDSLGSPQQESFMEIYS